MSRTTKKWLGLTLLVLAAIFTMLYKNSYQGWYAALAVICLIGSAAMNNFGRCPYCGHFGGQNWYSNYCRHCGHEL